MATAKKTARKAAPKKSKTLPQSKPVKKPSKWAKAQDAKFKAKKPGYRVSEETGNVYKEVRPNRSDVSRKNRI